MASIYIRAIPPEIYERLKERARRHRRSVTQEATVILEGALGKPERPEEVWEMIDSRRVRASSTSSAGEVIGLNSPLSAAR